MISVLLPVYNEADILDESIKKLHAYLEREKLPHEIIVTSNGSTDETNIIGHELMKKYSWFRFFSLPERGVGRAFVISAKNAHGDALVCLDIDLPSDLAFILYAKDLLKYVDMVIGSKFMGRQYRSAIRILGSQLYVVIAQWLFGISLSDFSPDSKAFKREAILPALEKLDGWTGYVFELALYLSAKNKRIVQISIDCKDRRKSKFNLLHEAFYRYFHLYRCWREFRNAKSWFHCT
ncbi:MAG: glycosyltransferase family 2 protein [Deltaproteobacteria bacterium]|nr:glycosyltransferase family 2 protein [Deltaproteobacteria bacterium]